MEQEKPHTSELIRSRFTKPKTITNDVEPLAEIQSTKNLQTIIKDLEELEKQEIKVITISSQPESVKPNHNKESTSNSMNTRKVEVIISIITAAAAAVVTLRSSRLP